MNTMRCLVPLLLIFLLFLYQSSAIETSQKREVKTVTIHNSQSQNYGLSHRLKRAVFQIQRRVLFPTEVTPTGVAGDAAKGVPDAAKGVPDAAKRPVVDAAKEVAQMPSPANRNAQFASISVVSLLGYMVLFLL
ncbi:hypothetical protein LguiB_031785 [Lonicera macranthoides]